MKARSELFLFTTHTRAKHSRRSTGSQGDTLSCPCLSLLDLLHAIHLKVGTQEPFHIISGYRSARTNAFLCKQNRGVVNNSLHLCGKAVDIRLPGYELSSLRRVAVNLRAGGVGYYPRSDFVHVDVGRVRNW